MSRAVQIERSGMRVGRNGNGKHIMAGTAMSLVNAASGGSTFLRKEIPVVKPENAPPLAAGTGGKIADRHTSAGALVHLARKEIHPLAEIVPGLPPDEMVRLIAHFKKVGAPEPLLAFKGKILERDRYLACNANGFDVRFQEWDGKGSLAETVARLNLPRLHLTDSQLACIAVPLAEQISAEHAQSRTAGLLRERHGVCGIASKTAIPANGTVGLNLGPRANGSGKILRAADIAAEICHHVSGSYVELAAKIWRESPELFQQVLHRRKDSNGREFNLHRAKGLLHRQNSRRALEAIATEKPERRKAADEMVVLGDCLEKMGALPGRKFNLIVADPPYNNGEEYDSDDTRDKRSDRDYLTWCKNWFSECARLLTPDGSFFVIISAAYQGRFDSILRSQTDPPLHWRNTIVWFERFGNHQTTKFTAETKFIHYFTRDKKRFTWNADTILVPSDRQTVYGDSRAVPEGKVPGNLWDVARMPGNDSKRAPWDNPPQIPPGVLERIVRVASNPGDLVFDPMCGNGTTGRAALKLGRRFLGIERSPLYAEQARRWIAASEEPGRVAPSLKGAK
jgi:DNA modification methylase